MDKRFLFALGLSAAVMVLWFQVAMPLISPSKPKPAPAPGTEEPGKQPADQARPDKAAIDKPGPDRTVPGESESAGPKDPAPAPAAAPAKPGRTSLSEAKSFTLETSELTALLNSRGARLESVTLKNFMDPFAFPKESKPFRLLRDMESGRFAFELVLDQDPGRLDREIWEVEESSSGSVAFLFNAGDGLSIRKTFSVRPDGESASSGFMLDVRVEALLDKASPSPAQVSYSLTGPAGISPEFETQGRMLHGFVGFGVEARSPTVKYYSPSDVFGADNRRIAVRDVAVHWLGVANKYFGSVMVALTPDSVQSGLFTPVADSESYAKLPPKMSAEDKLEKASDNIAVSVATRPVDLAPGTSFRHDYVLFTGPKEKKHLVSAAFDISGIMDVSYIFCLPQALVSWLALAILAILKMFYAVFGNYGLAIIFMTILVKLILLPVSIKQQMSMSEYQRKMKKVQPLLKAAKEKYKNDRNRQSQETMKIMKEHGVSVLPFKGCLPIFLQFPIFIALFYTLRYCIELRQQGFLYMADLARPDRLFEFPAFIPQIPLIGPFLGTHFNLLPILWIAVMLVSQKYSPMKTAAADDPQMAQQQKMMSVMMVVFGFLFFTIESGCVMYIIVSTLIGMGEQYLIRRKLAAAQE